MLKLSSGKSEKDRISFYTSDNGATAIRNQNGEITIEYGKWHMFVRPDGYCFRAERKPDADESV